MVSFLIASLGQTRVDMLAFVLGFALSALLITLFRDKLPHDHGRQYAVNGELSRGKARGAGVVLVPCVALVSMAFMPFTAEYAAYMALLVAAMLSGYLDDAAETPWNEYKKGLLDLIIAVLTAVTFLNFDGPTVYVLGYTWALPAPVYLVLAVILIWVSINVTNCSDGVDGLSASVAIVVMGTFAVAFSGELGSYRTAVLVYIAALLAYLWRNASPCELMMGDAGSRAMGFFIAVLAMKSHHPFAYLLAALVFILDGGLGILKISLKRFLHIPILTHTLTPLHDHARKRMGWSDTQVVFRFVTVQVLLAALLCLLEG